MVKIQSSKSKVGFTLIETLVYLTIISILVVAFVGFSISISKTRNKAYVIQEVQANARTALDLISREIRAATGVNIESSTFDSDPGVLSLIMANSEENPTIIDLDSDDGFLQIRRGTDDPVVITNNKVKVVNLVFTNLTPLAANRENIRIEMTVRYNDDSGGAGYGYSYNLRTAVSLRQ